MSRDSTGTLEISVIRPAGSEDDRYYVFVPYFGTTGCGIKAANANEAKRKLAEFIGNELLERSIE